MDGRSDRQWFSRERVLALALGLATLLALYVCYLIVKPFVPTVVMALALAVATNRPFRWLRSHIRNETLASAIAVILVAFVIIAPLTLLLTNITQQIVIHLRDLQAGNPLENWRDTIYAKPVLGNLLRWAEANLDLETQLTGLARNLAGRAGGLLAGSVNLITQLVIMLFVLFFLYRDRRAALAAVRRLIPLSRQEADQIFARIADTILAILNGSLTVALVQATLAGVMYTILGVPAAILWGAATFLVALVPVFGTVMVWGPVAIYLGLTGSWVKAAVLVGWGALAVGTIDNFLYPHLVGDRLRLHTLPTFFAILGGIGLFGPAGLILGPVTLAITIGLLNVWSERTEDDAAPESLTRSGSTPHEP
jgi:predicted PurR-regulated permease PerM